MTMHTTINVNDRCLLPRSLIARRSPAALPATLALPGKRRRVYHAFWKFRLGADVQFGNDMNAKVLSRRRTARGRELYDIEVIGENYGRPQRTVMAAALWNLYRADNDAPRPEPH